MLHWPNITIPGVTALEQLKMMKSPKTCTKDELVTHSSVHTSLHTLSIGMTDGAGEMTERGISR